MGSHDDALPPWMRDSYAAPVASAYGIDADVYVPPSDDALAGTPWELAMRMHDS